MPKFSWLVLPSWLRWSAAPIDAPPLQRRNFINVQIDGVGVGLASAAAPFLPVFLVRLGASMGAADQRSQEGRTSQLNFGMRR